MYLSKITLPTSRLTPERLMEMMARGEYVMHQWLWELFPGVAQRQYLYRRETLQNGFCFYLLSASAPERTHPLFEIQTRPFAPALDEGAALRFSLRANPVITRNGKRHDVLMNAKREVRPFSQRGEVWGKQEQAALAREKKLQEATLAIKKKFGKNAILRGMNLEEGATARERNARIGGHKA